QPRVAQRVAGDDPQQVVGQVTHAAILRKEGRILRYRSRVGDERAVVGRHIDEQANAAMVVGTRYSAAFGFVSGALIAILTLAGAVRDVQVAMLFAFVGGVVSLGIHLLARRRQLRGAVVYATMLA